MTGGLAASGSASSAPDVKCPQQASHEGVQEVGRHMTILQGRSHAPNGGGRRPPILQGAGLPFNRLPLRKDVRELRARTCAGTAFSTTPSNGPHATCCFL